MNSNLFKKFALGAFIGAAAFTLVGCGSSKSSGGDPKVKPSISMKLAPEKGPFKKASIRAYGLEESKAPKALTLGIVKEFSDTNAEAEVKLFGTDLEKYDNIVFAFSGVETEGDFQSDGTKSGDLQLGSFFFVIPSELEQEGKTLTADIFDHIGAVKALSASGATIEGLKKGEVNDVQEVRVSDFDSTVNGTMSQVLAQVSGQTLSDIDEISIDERKAIGAFFVAGLLDAAKESGSLTDVFKGHFADLTTKLTEVDNSSISKLFTTTDGGFVKPLSKEEADKVTSALGITIDASSIYDAAKATEAIDFQDTDFSLHLANFVPTVGNDDYYEIKVNLDSGTNTAELIANFQYDGNKFKRLATKLSDKEYYSAQVRTSFATDIISFSTVSAGAEFKSTHVTSIEVGAYFRLGYAGGSFTSIPYSNLSIAITTDSGKSLTSASNAAAPLTDFISEAKVQFTTPTNASGSINLSSSYGAWLMTDSNFATADVTGLVSYNYGVQYYLKKGDNTWRLGCRAEGTQGHDGDVYYFDGQDFVYDHGVTYNVKKIDDLTKANAKAYLVPEGLDGIDNPSVLESLAFCSLDLETATTDVVKSSWGTLSTTERLTAKVAWDSTGQSIKVTSPKLYSFAEPHMGNITIMDHAGARKTVDAGLRVGFYGLAIVAEDLPVKADGTTHKIEHPTAATDAALEDALIYTAFFFVDKEGDVWSHSGIGETTAEFLKYHHADKLGTRSSFALTVTSKTFGYFGDRFNSGYKVVADAEVVHFADDSAAKSAFATYVTTSTTVAIFSMLDRNINYPEEMSYRSLVEIEGKLESSELTLYVTGDALTLKDDPTLPAYLLATPSDNKDDNEKAGFYLVKNGIKKSDYVTNPSYSGFAPDLNITKDQFGSVRPIIVLDDGDYYLEHDELPTAEINRPSYYSYGFEFIKDYTEFPVPIRNITDGDHSITAYYNPFGSHTSDDNCDTSYGGVYLGATGVIATGSTSATIKLTDEIKKPTVTFIIPE